MPFLNVLYKDDDFDAIINFLKSTFGADASKVSIVTGEIDNYVSFTWDVAYDANQIAASMTSEIPDVVIECESNTGIDLRSRYFNKNQLW